MKVFKRGRRGREFDVMITLAWPVEGWWGMVTYWGPEWRSHDEGDRFFFERVLLAKQAEFCPPDVVANVLLWSATESKGGRGR